MKKIFFWLIAIIMMFSTVSCTNPLNKEREDDFSFTLVWGVWGKSSYNSKTGELVKSKYESNMQDFVTTLFLSDDQLDDIYSVLYDLKIHKYDEFKYNEFAHSNPGEYLNITVYTNDYCHEISTTSDINLDKTYSNKALKFKETIQYITNIIYQTDEWKSLPKEEKIYF